MTLGPRWAAPRFREDDTVTGEFLQLFSCRIYSNCIVVKLQRKYLHDWLVAVGTEVSSYPRTDPCERHYRTGLLPWVCDAKPFTWIRMSITIKRDDGFTIGGPSCTIGLWFIHGIIDL